ncbi:putative RNA degradation protein [Listeria monocytogenes]|nr:putative RNA degradation protein [Listeria monocytogenes]
MTKKKIKSVFLLERQRKHQKNNQLKRNKFHLAKTTKVLTLYAIN